MLLPGPGCRGWHTSRHPDFRITHREISTDREGVEFVGECVREVKPRSLRPYRESRGRDGCWAESGRRLRDPKPLPHGRHRSVRTRPGSLDSRNRAIHELHALPFLQNPGMAELKSSLSPRYEHLSELHEPLTGVGSDNVGMDEQVMLLRGSLHGLNRESSVASEWITRLHRQISRQIRRRSARNLSREAACTTIPRLREQITRRFGVLTDVRAQITCTQGRLSDRESPICSRRGCRSEVRQ